VESVVWISERKDVLSGCFFFLTLLAWLRYAQKQNWITYLLVLIFFALGLMAKPMLVTLPLLLLLLDFWPLERFPQLSRFRLLLEKLPLLFLSLASSAATLFAQRQSINSLEQVSFFFRLGNALNSYLFYLSKTLWPVDLGLIYPYPQKLPILLTIAAVIVLTVFSVATFLYRKRFPYLYVGWFWFVIALLPVIGLLQVGRQAYADRYTYLPQIGLFIALVWGLDALTSSWRHRQRIAWVAAVVVLLALARASYAQVRLWRDPVNLWTHTVEVTDDNYIAHSNLADALMHQGRVGESLAEAEAAVRLNPGAGDAQNNLALALFRSGRLKEAAAHWEIAYRLRPQDRNIESNFSWLLATSPESSLRDGARAVELTQDLLKQVGRDNPKALRTASAALAEAGRFSEAITLTEHALSLARAKGNATLVDELNRNLASYQKGLPLRDPGVIAPR
jgi:tetratricopeptide (TPR) repeat protein